MRSKREKWLEGFGDTVIGVFKDPARANCPGQRSEPTQNREQQKAKRRAGGERERGGGLFAEGNQMQ